MTFWPKKFYLSLFDKKWLFWTKGNSEFLLNLKITGRVYAEVFCINSINLILFNCMKLYEIVAELRVSKGYPLTPLTLFMLGGDKFAHQLLFLCLSQKFFPATYDETSCKFLLYTYKDSHNLFWSKILSREHVEYFYVAWVENVNFKNCNFRVLRSILEGFFIK